MGSDLAAAIPSTWLADLAGRPVVLHVRVVTGSGGGPDKTILASASRLRVLGYAVAAAYLRTPGDTQLEVLERRGRILGCPVIGIPDRGPLDPLVLPRLLQVCRRLNVRVWHGHEYKSNVLGLLLRPWHSMKLVTTLHGWVQQTRRTRLYYAIDRLCLPYYDYAMSVSDDLDHEAGRLGVAADQRSLLPNGVDQETFRRRVLPAHAELRQQRRVPSGRVILGACGRLSPEKGFDTLIRAAVLLVQNGMDAELWIAGEGESRGDLEALIRHHSLGDRVKLLGLIDDMGAFYEALDGFVISSLREGLPNVLLEAMAMQVPVVATAIAGIPSVIRDGENGILCRPADVHDLATCLRELMSDGALRERLASAARRTVESRFSFADRVIAEKEIYDKLLSPRA